MQIPFKTNHLAQVFSQENSNLFPPPPDRCPFKDCKMPVKLKKHGYYSRYLISSRFKGVIFIRRYICPICGRTISFFPVFILQRFTYSAIDILNLLFRFYKEGDPLSTFIESVVNDFAFLSRRHLNYYRRRIIKNRKLIQYGLNLISPEFFPSSRIPDNQMWVKAFLTEVHNMDLQAFLFEFSMSTGKSFMTANNMVA